MTAPQIRLFIKEGERIKRRDRAAFISDLHSAVSGVLGNTEGLQKRIDELLKP